MYYQIEVVSSFWQRGDLRGYGATIKVIGGAEEIPVSVVRPCRKRVPPNRAWT